MTPDAEIRAAMVEAACSTLSWDVDHIAMGKAITAAILVMEARGYKVTGPEATEEMARSTDKIVEWICSEIVWSTQHAVAPKWGDV